MSHHGRSGDQKTTVCVGRPHTCRGGRGGNHRVKGWCVKKTLEPEACSAVGFKHRGGSKGRGA